MNTGNWDVVVIGLSLTSSWGNGHATTYRALLRALSQRGRRILFLERDVPWYAAHRDLAHPDFCDVRLYASIGALRARFSDAVRNADLVIVGSYVPEGVAIAEWATRTTRGVTAFYDIDTPITLAKLSAGDEEYLARRTVPRFDMYLSFTGGPTLQLLERKYGARVARPLYCAVDTSRYRLIDVPPRWDLGYMGTYSADRQPTIDRLLVDPARQAPHGAFVMAGPQYPAHLEWPGNVERVEHLPPDEHPSFYASQRFTLNVTRAAMIAAGWSPSVRLFEAAACGTPIISDWWEGLDSLFEPGEEIIIARGADDVLAALHDLDPEDARRIGFRARQRVLSEHTAEHRAAELEGYVDELRGSLDLFRVESMASHGLAEEHVAP